MVAEVVGGEDDGMAMPALDFGFISDPFGPGSGSGRSDGGHIERGDAGVESIHISLGSGGGDPMR